MYAEKFWYYLWTIVLAIVVTCIIYFGFMQDRPIRGYYLSSTNSHEGIGIGVDIDNWADDYIPMNGIELSKIIQTIDSLNINLKRK